MRSEKVRWSVGVVIPAQNEEMTMELCIRSVLKSLHSVEIARWVVVVADACSDRTVERARTALGDAGEVVEVAYRSAGASRREGVARVLERWKDKDPTRIWLANADADSEVSDDWIAVQLGFADKGVMAVAGIVRLDAGVSPETRAVYRDTYLTHSAGTHSHVHGANLSVRADAYQDVGGWSNLALAEDHCLWTRLRANGWRVISAVSSVVTTSARLVGRAKGGFADTLKARIEALFADA